MPLLLAFLLAASLHAEIRGVLKSAAIDTQLAKTNGSQVVHQRPNFAISLNVRTGPQGAPETQPNADEVMFIRRGSGTIWIADRKHDIGAGDVVNVPRGVTHRIEPVGRLEYVAIQIFPTGQGQQPQSGLLAPRKMPDVLTASEIAHTLANFNANQPIHSAPNFTMNYVIYGGHAGPWEAHRGCVDIYFLRLGTASAQLGGEIQNIKEESPGEPRGTGVTGAQRYSIGPGDIVVIPRNTAHHIDPGSQKLGYILMKVWAE